jgi:hypothetical protein
MRATASFFGILASIARKAANCCAEIFESCVACKALHVFLNSSPGAFVTPAVGAELALVKFVLDGHETVEIWGGLCDCLMSCISHPEKANTINPAANTNNQRLELFLSDNMFFSSSHHPLPHCFYRFNFMFTMILWG